MKKTEERTKNWQRKQEHKQEILRQLRSQPSIQREKIMEFLDISKESFNRYLKELRAEGCEINALRGRCQSGLYELENKTTAPVATAGGTGAATAASLTDEEERALNLVCQLLAGSDNSLTTTLHGLHKKLCPKAAANQQHRGSRYFTGQTQKKELDQLKWLLDIANAIENGWTLKINYCSRHTGREDINIWIQPYYLEMLDGIWRLLALRLKGEAPINTSGGNGNNDNSGNPNQATNPHTGGTVNEVQQDEMRTYELIGITSLSVIKDPCGALAALKAEGELSTPEKEMKNTFGRYYTDGEKENEDIQIRFSLRMTPPLDGDKEERYRSQPGALLASLSRERYRIQQTIPGNGSVTVHFQVNHIYLVEWLRDFMPAIEWISHEGLRETLLNKILLPQVERLKTNQKRPIENKDQT